MANITNKMRYFIAILALLVVSGMACCQEIYPIQMAPVPVYTMANQVYPHVIQSIDKIPGGARSVSVGYDLGQDLNLYILDHIRPSYCAPAIEKRPVVVTLKKNRFETDIVLETVYNLFRKQTYETGITSNKIICPRITD